MNIHVYRMDCITNLHVGSGDVNYNIVDNEVERDVATEMPTINSSGVKGAIREQCVNSGKYERAEVIKIFGQDNKKRKDKDGKEIKPEKTVIPGSYKFLSADFIARPLRVTSDGMSSIPVTTPDALKNFAKLLMALGCDKYNCLKEIELGTDGFAATEEGICIEGERAAMLKLSDEQKQSIGSLLGDTYALTNSLKEYDLPVIARNFLEDGISQNLWYEEVVPHGSVFATVIITPEADCALDELFKECVQFGANASIGYGIMKLTKLYPEGGSEE